MKPLRAVFTLLLVAIATVLVGCGDPDVQAPPTYTSEKIAQLQLYLTPFSDAQERLAELGKDVEKNDWTNVKSVIHGPFGTLRASAENVNRILLKKDQKQAITLSKALFNDLEKLDIAADPNIPANATAAYQAAVRDLDAYLDFIPTQPDSDT
ncbi:MAG: photosystem II protein PsbQ [Cyanobacteria bacterium P01_G01_bin.54]